MHLAAGRRSPAAARTWPSSEGCECFACLEALSVFFVGLDVGQLFAFCSVSMLAPGSPHGALCMCRFAPHSWFIHVCWLAHQWTRPQCLCSRVFVCDFLVLFMTRTSQQLKVTSDSTVSVGASGAECRAAEAALRGASEDLAALLGGCRGRRGAAASDRPQCEGRGPPRVPTAACLIDLVCSILRFSASAHFQGSSDRHAASSAAGMIYLECEDGALSRAH